MTALRMFATVMIAWAAVPAQAQLYKCVVDGRTVYQQARCADGTPVNASGAGRADPTSTGALQARRDVLRYQRRELIDQAVRSGQLVVGMSADEVREVWGRPTKINRTFTATAVREQWVYRGADIGKTRYAYLENGELTSYQDDAGSWDRAQGSLGVLR